jgi:hypothetical protein
MSKRSPDTFFCVRGNNLQQSNRLLKDINFLKILLLPSKSIHRYVREKAYPINWCDDGFNGEGIVSGEVDSF